MWDLKKKLEERKENLILLLTNKRDFLELEKQHQIYGAIKELDHVLELMEQYREDDMKKIKQLVITNDALKESLEGAGAFKKAEEKIKKFKSPIRIRFAKSDA